VGKANKYHFILIGRGDSAEKGTFASESNFKYCIKTVKLLWPSQNLLWPPNIPSVCCRPYKIGVEPPYDLIYTVGEIQAKQKLLKFDAS